MTKRWIAALLFAVGCASGVADAGSAQELPAGLAFIGWKEQAWRLFVVLTPGALHEVPTALEPRAASVSLAAQRAVYVSAAGDLRTVSLGGGDDTVLIARSEERALAQPVFAPDGASVYVVEMKRGTSAETDILEVKLGKSGSMRTVVSQPGAQFEPSLARSGRYLLYTSVSCVLGCGRILQEVWRKDLVGGEAIQLTLLNAIARQPVAMPDGTGIYFSSDQGGNYHIWRIGWNGEAPQPQTRGPVTDSNPVAASDGHVYFVRHAAGGVTLMRLDREGRADALQFPAGIESIRDLEIAE
jgi:Tol biopolymer transport system component